MASPQDSRYSPELDRSAMPKPLSTQRSLSRAGDPPIEPPLKSPNRYAVGAPQLPPIALVSNDQPAEAAPAVVPEPIAPVEEKKDLPVPPQPKKDDAVDASRPGLGRMFGANKKSTKELIGKAAAMHSVFKPRAGGAAAKLFANEPAATNEPDGITGVVPAPNLKRSQTTDSITSNGSIQVTPTSAVAAKKSLPELAVTSPDSPAKPMLEPPISSLSAKVAKNVSESTQQMSDLQKRAADLQLKSKAAEEEAARRKLRRTPQQVKYLDRLGIDTAYLDGKGLEYEVILEEFWPQTAWHQKTIESLQAEVRKEMSKVQTGTWFDHIASHDEDRNSAIKLVDSALDECEQLEKLLTIYSVELGVCSPSINFVLC